MKQRKSFNLRVFSPNKSCAPLRRIPFNRRVFLRFGSTTPFNSKFKYLELNSIEGVKVSANKILMKHSFDTARVKHSEWITSNNAKSIEEFFLKHKVIICKHKHSSKGNGIYYIDNLAYLKELISKINLSQHIFERFYFYPHEYRVHVDRKHGAFYICKKFLEDGVDVEWHRHANNAGFAIVNKLDEKPECWNNVIDDCIKAMSVMHLDIACFDILCSNTEWILLESNSAPSLANFGLNIYCNHLKKYYDTRV